MAVIRTRLFCTGPFGFGGAIGTGTGTTAWLGGVDRDIPRMFGGDMRFNGWRRRCFFLGVDKRREQQSSVTDDKNAFHGRKGSKVK